jgi:hypothetical protein
VVRYRPIIIKKYSPGGYDDPRGETSTPRHAGQVAWLSAGGRDIAKYRFARILEDNISHSTAGYSIFVV